MIDLINSKEGDSIRLLESINENVNKEAAELIEDEGEALKEDLIEAKK